MEVSRVVVGGYSVECDNEFVEVVNSYEDGELSVGKYGLSDWKWLWSIFGGGNVVNMLGSVEDVVFENDVSWNEMVS